MLLEYPMFQGSKVSTVIIFDIPFFQVGTKLMNHSQNNIGLALGLKVGASLYI